MRPRIEVRLQDQDRRHLIDDILAAGAGHIGGDQCSLRLPRAQPFIPRLDRDLQPAFQRLDEVHDLQALRSQIPAQRQGHTGHYQDHSPLLDQCLDAHGVRLRSAAFDGFHG